MREPFREALKGDALEKKPWEDCSKDSLPYYTPIQAAIRWCGLTHEETAILAKCGEKAKIAQSDFPAWPCLHVHWLSIDEAIKNGALAVGRDGRNVADGDHVAPARRTISHALFKAWIKANYPAEIQKKHMAWLFDDVERTLHPAVTLEAYQTLKAENDALKKRLEKAVEVHKEQQAMIDALRIPRADSLGARERNNMLRIVRALSEMARLPEKGAAPSVEIQLQELGFTSPKEETIRKVLGEAKGLEPDENPN